MLIGVRPIREKLIVQNRGVKRQNILSDVKLIQPILMGIQIHDYFLYKHFSFPPSLILETIFTV